MWRTEDRTFRVELHEERRVFRVYWLGFSQGTFTDPDEVDALIKELSAGKYDIGDLIED